MGEMGKWIKGKMEENKKGTPLFFFPVLLFPFSTQIGHAVPAILSAVCV
jgi:hypothetical protein